MRAGADVRCRGPGAVIRSAGEGADLDEVVGEDCLSGPDACSVEAVEAAAVPAVAAFEAADAALAAGAPLDDSAERRAVFEGLSGLAGAALARDDDGSDAEVVQVVVDARLAVAAVGGNGARAASGAGDHPGHGRGPVRAITRATAGASCGASGGLPSSRVWSSTTPSSLSSTWAL